MQGCHPAAVVIDDGIPAVNARAFIGLQVANISTAIGSKKILFSSNAGLPAVGPEIIHSDI
jgi:hypothetical protein